MKRCFKEKSWRSDPGFRDLCKAFLACSSLDDVANLFRDVATLSEMKTMSERLEVADLLLSGLPYREVSQKTGASTTTVTRVAWFLNNGEGGYRKTLPIISTHHHAALSARRGRRGST